MIRVLHVVSKMDAGGIETYLMNLYRSINRECIQFDFLVHYKERGFYDDEIEQLGGKIYRFDVRENHNYPKYVRNLNHFFSVHNDYSIIHGHMTSLSFIYMRLAKQHGITNRIVHSHGDSHENNIKGWIKYLLYKLAKKNATQRFACSERSGQYLFDAEDFSVLPNAICVDKFAYNKTARQLTREKNHAENKIIIGCVARFHPQKNHDFLIDIFYEFQKKKSDAELWLIGKGPLEGDIRSKCIKYGIDTKVKFLGVVSDTENYYQAMDIFILPSNFEGLGIVFVEAQTSGLLTFGSERIPVEAVITDNMHLISLERTAQEWAEEIEVRMNGYERESQVQTVKMHGYDVTSENIKIQKIYENMVNMYEYNVCGE